MKSARINFGKANSEYVMKIDDNGAATSLVNQDTNTEYVGGGGGGDSDYSEKTITFYNENLTDEKVYITCPCTITELTSGEIVDDTETIGNIEFTIPANSSNINRTVTLYKGKAVAYIEGTPRTYGSIQVIEIGKPFYLITGDCEVSFE